MLRISLIRNTTGPVFLRLEGDMIGPWVDEARRVCQPLVDTGERFRIDLGDVGFADRSGLELLALLQQHEAVLDNCPAFLKAQLALTRQYPLGHAIACVAGG